ncbi:hypothetical protein KAJ89_04385 [Candidatus Parcubacteria bacterium]|nr:hypothetical protein [Candidatus Parcubacteria bacterium]
MTNEIVKPSEIDKHIAFAESFISNNRNATKAYKDIYGDHLSDEVASVSASRLLRNDKVRVYLRRKFSKIKLDADFILREIKNIAETSQHDNTRLKALVWLGKAMGVFSQDYIEQERIIGEPSEKVKKFIDAVIEIKKNNPQPKIN